MALTAIVFAVLGTASGRREDMRALVHHELYGDDDLLLSGALFPLSNLPVALTIATRLDPLAYGIDGLRGAFIGLSQIGFATDLIVLAVVASAFLALGARSFSRIQI